MGMVTEHFFSKLLGALQIGFPRAFYKVFQKSSDKKLSGYFIAFITFLSIFTLLLVFFKTNTDHFFLRILIGIVFGLMAW